VGFNSDTSKTDNLERLEDLLLDRHDCLGQRYVRNRDKDLGRR